MFRYVFVLAAFCPLIMGQHFQQTTTTPIPILKQINRVNDDGSYTYGYESADGTYKIETRDADGNVRGKYAYVDDTGNVKTVDYAAGEPTQTKGGFEARGAHVPEFPNSAPHDPSQLTDDDTEHQSANVQQQPRAKSLNNNQSPLSAFMSSNSGSNWPAAQHRFTAPNKQRSAWDNANTGEQQWNTPANSNKTPRRGFNFEFEAPSSAQAASPRNQAPVNKVNNQPKQSSFDVNFQNFPSSF